MTFSEALLQPMLPALILLESKLPADSRRLKLLNFIGCEGHMCVMNLASSFLMETEQVVTVLLFPSRGQVLSLCKNLPSD